MTNQVNQLLPDSLCPDQRLWLTFLAKSKKFCEAINFAGFLWKAAICEAAVALSRVTKALEKAGDGRMACRQMLWKDVKKTWTLATEWTMQFIVGIINDKTDAIYQHFSRRHFLLKNQTKHCMWLKVSPNKTTQIRVSTNIITVYTLHCKIGKVQTTIKDISFYCENALQCGEDGSTLWSPQELMVLIPVRFHRFPQKLAQ